VSILGRISLTNKDERENSPQLLKKNSRIKDPVRALIRRETVTMFENCFRGPSKQGQTSAGLGGAQRDSDALTIKNHSKIKTDHRMMAKSRSSS